jgi:hypothetical protein
VALATQLTLSLANDIGTLAKLCRDLADAGVNLLALSASDRADEAGGAIRLLVANPEQAQKALGKAGYSFHAEDVLFVELKNRPGALAKATERLSRANINIRYAYATTYRRAQRTAAVIAVTAVDLAKAARLVAGH